jgi:hypothetical protein
MHTNAMLCRISVTVPKHGRQHRAYYTVRSDSSSRLLAFLGGHFSHFRKQASRFAKRDDGRVYELSCEAKDPVCNGYFKAQMESLSKKPPVTSCFRDIAEATDFVFQLDGSCGYDFKRGRLSFQKIDYPKWDLQFCHAYTFDFALLKHLFATYDLEAEFDCVLFMEKVPQVWRSSWLYREAQGAKLQREEVLQG